MTLSASEWALSRPVAWILLDQRIFLNETLSFQSDSGEQDMKVGTAVASRADELPTTSEEN